MKRVLRLGAVAAAVALIGAGATLSLLPAREAAGAATVMLPPAKAAALVQAKARTSSWPSRLTKAWASRSLGKGPTSRRLVAFAGVV